MYNITLIGTIHSEHGKCNPDTLYKILEDINPEVIFDELPNHFAELYFRSVTPDRSEAILILCSELDGITIKQLLKPKEPMNIPSSKITLSLAEL